MAKFFKTEMTCKCCGNEYQDRVLTGAFLGRTRDMDTNPHEPALYEKVLICPHCGYATDRADLVPSQAVRRLVREDENYRAIFTDPSMDRAKKKMLLAARVCEAMGEERNAGMYYLRAAWRTRELAESAGEGVPLARGVSMSDATECLLAAADHLERFLMENESIGTAIVYTDVLRQLGRFDEAEETARGLEPLVEEKYEKKVLAYERKLIAAKDTEPRSQKGVEA